MGARPTVAGMNAIEALGNPGWGWDDFLPYAYIPEVSFRKVFMLFSA